MFCVVGRSEGSSPEMKGRDSLHKRSLSRNSAHQIGTGGSETTSLNTTETGPSSLRKPKFSSAPDIQNVGCTSPGELRGAGLLSCFPSFKTGANKGKQYQLVVRSPNGTAESPRNFARKMSRLLHVIGIF